MGPSMTGPSEAEGAGAIGMAGAGGALLVLVQAARTSAMKATPERTFIRITVNPCYRLFEKPLHIGLEGLP
jgi:hypothetical protein